MYFSPLKTLSLTLVNSIDGSICLETDIPHKIDGVAIVVLDLDKKNKIKYKYIEFLMNRYEYYKWKRVIMHEN